MNTKQLIELGNKHISGFIGVFALDKIPSLQQPCKFIINTDTNNLAGKHWIAVSYESYGIVYAFDPLGVFYPRILCNRLFGIRSVKRVVFNRTMYQNPFSQTCGMHCIDWLKDRYKYISKHTKSTNFPYEDNHNKLQRARIR